MDLMRKHPDLVPTVIQADADFFARLSPATAEAARAVLEPRKFAIPRTWTVGHLVHKLRSKIKLPDKYAMFLFVRQDDSVLPCVSSTLQDTHDSFSDPDTGVLHITLTIERTFG